VTADSGQDSMLVVWDSVWANPKWTYFTPHEWGVEALDISPDADYIVTLSSSPDKTFTPQTISLWDLNSDSNEPIVSTTFTHNELKRQHSVKFNTFNIEEIVTTGYSSVLFFSWDKN